MFMRRRTPAQDQAKQDAVYQSSIPSQSNSDVGFWSAARNFFDTMHGGGKSADEFDNTIRLRS